MFSAEFAFNVVVMSVASYSAGLLTDKGVPVHRVAMITGVALLIPAILWALAQRLWRDVPYRT